MILIIKACEAIVLLHKHLKSEISILFRDFDCTLAQNAHNFAALHRTIFSKLHHVPDVILLRNLKMAYRSLQRMEKLARLVYRIISPDFYTAR